VKAFGWHRIWRATAWAWRVGAILVLLLATAGWLAAQTPPAGDKPQVPPPASEDQAPGGQEIQVPPPPFTDGIFPCTQCHDGVTVPLNTKRRKLVDMHDDIVLHHGPNMWCLDCHSAEHRDELHLVDGELIPFSKLYLLCGQCHGDKLRDWKVGVHGKRTGYWNGKKQYLLCVNCHNPHSPHFAPIKPLPPPVPPDQIIPAKGGTP
jgi:hypothetical protein